MTIAMYGLIQFYVQLKGELAPHRPFLKLLCIKLVIFFSFWQSVCSSLNLTPLQANLPLQFFISFVSSSNGPFQPTPHIAYPDISIGIPSMLLCLEMAIFAVMHVFAYSWKEYRLTSTHADDPNAPKASYQGGALGLRALGQAFNPWDIIKACGRGFRWLFIGRRFREQDVSYSYHADMHASPKPLDGAFGEREGATQLGPVLAKGAGGHAQQQPAPPPPPKDSSEYRGASAAARRTGGERPLSEVDPGSPVAEAWDPINEGRGGYDHAGLLHYAVPPARGAPRDAMGNGW